MRAVAGALVVLAHGLVFAAAVAHCRGTELAVEIPGGRVPAELADRVAIDDTHGPGLVRRRWSVTYRGGIERAVGAAQLVGPFQDPAAHACVGRVVIGQRLLAGGVAATVQQQLEAELAGENIFPIGDFQRIDQLQLAWAEPAKHPEDLFWIGAAPFGYVRASARVVFARVDVPIVVAFVPDLATTELHFRIAAHAELAFDNSVVQWVSDKLGGDKLATRLARRQIDDTLVTVLAPPPPFELSGGQTIRFTYCKEPIEIRDGAYGALPFGIELGAAADPHILPPRFGRGPRPVPSPTTALALDLDLDALNALLYELWRGRFLDRQLAEAGLDRRFNSDPTVTEFLTIRLSPLVLALPPVVTVGAQGLRLSAEARVAIADGEQRTVGRVWGALDFRFANSLEPVAVDVGELELSCERTPNVLVPCFSDLVSAVRGRAADFHGALTQTFATLLREIFVGRIGAAGMPADIVIHTATPTLVTASETAALHLELEAAIAPTK